MPSTLQPVDIRNQSEPSSQSQTLSVLGVALVVRLFVLRSVLAQHPPSWLFTRGIEMGLLAKSLLAGLGLSSPFGASTGPTAFIAPGYPILVAGIFSLFGIDSIASEVVVLSLHLIANLMTIWLVMHVARRLFDQRIALIAGILWTLSPPLWWLPTIFWDTSIAICLFMGLFALTLRYQTNPTRLVWLGLGAYCGVLALINPALLLSAAGILVWLALTNTGASRRNSILAAVAFVLVFCPWPIRNARAFHAFVPLRTTVGFELWMGNHPGSSGYLEEDLFPMYNQAELNAYIQQGEISYTDGKSRLARTYILQHPSTFAALTLRRILRFWTGTGTQGGSGLFALHATLTSIFGLAGLWLLLHKHRRKLFLLFATPFLVFPLPYYITHAEFRYRLIIDPLLTTLSAYALVAAYRRYAYQEPPPATAAPQVPHG